MPLVDKYFNELKGSYGLYAKNTGDLNPPYSRAPDDSDWTAVNVPAAKYLQVRYSWRALCPTTRGVYTFDKLIGPLLEKCAE